MHLFKKCGRSKSMNGPRLNEHDKFHELGALANSGTLTGPEWAELKAHLRTCADCRDICNQYLVLACEGMPLLATQYGQQHEKNGWREETTRRKLLARVRVAKQEGFSEAAGQLNVAAPRKPLWRILGNAPAITAFAASLIIIAAVVGYHFGYRARVSVNQAPSYFENHYENPLREKENSGDELLSTQVMELSQLRKEILQREAELVKLKSTMRVLDQRANELAAAKNTTDEQLRTISQQRDSLSSRLQEAEQTYRNIQTEFSNLRSEHEKETLQIGALESKIDELSVANRDQARRIAEADSYLASNRDIREMMGARKLYIADVFDVDSRSRTRSAFGRVFYTSGKSLLFYAFDLDGQANLKNASTFQAWGRMEAGGGKPLNLGIFYLDSETNRRWVLRFNDPKRLPEIDEVFVTVEPHGGSVKPTGKPFLYALLRQEANHP
jgi:hypothetical protein